MDPREIVLDLLVFRQGPTRFGVDAAQVAEVVSLADAQVLAGVGGARLRRGGAEVPLVRLGSGGWTEVGEQGGAAKLVLPKGSPPPAAFLMGEPEEMLQVRAEAVEGLPPLVRAMVRGSGMWAAVPGDGGLVILVDLVEAGAAAVSRPGSPPGAS